MPHEFHIEVANVQRFGKGMSVTFKAVAIKQIHFCLLCPGIGLSQPGQPHLSLIGKLRMKHCGIADGRELKACRGTGKGHH